MIDRKVAEVAERMGIETFPNHRFYENGLGCVGVKVRGWFGTWWWIKDGNGGVMAWSSLEVAKAWIRQEQQEQLGRRKRGQWQLVKNP